MSSSELTQFLATWDEEAKRTEKLLASLPDAKYDFRPYPECRSLGELAWHLSEIDAYMSESVVAGQFDFSAKLPGLERPRAIAELAPGYTRVHTAAAARVRALPPEALEKQLDFMGRPMRAGDVLWVLLLHHSIHHRGQLMMMARLAGGTPAGVYGPTREEMAAMRG